MGQADSDLYPLPFSEPPRDEIPTYQGLYKRQKDTIRLDSILLESSGLSMAMSMPLTRELH